MDQLLVVHHPHLFPQVPCRRFINLSPFVLAILSVCSVVSADFLVSFCATPTSTPVLTVLSAYPSLAKCSANSFPGPRYPPAA